MNLSKYDRGIETRVRKFNGEYYLIGKGKVYSLNYLGAVVLKYIGSDITVNELSNKISEKYPGTDIETISK
ncbi:TPA: hypothetical protein U1341_002212 [Streptococcus suis]|nr:hypothetical protein [Streptococcus suis]